GDRAVAGTIATDSAIRVRIEAVGEQTALAGIRRLVEQAQGSHSHVQALADRAAAALFYFAAGAGLLTFLVWLLLGEPQQAIERAVTVLVIACPHALGLAIPLVIAISTATAAKAGILVKDRLALERMRQVDTVLFDKTGTLTIGRPAVTNVVAADGGTADLLALAAAVESDSEHPLAGAIVTAAARRGPIPAARDFVSLPGRGVQADVNGQLITVGGPAVLADLQVPEVIRSAADEWSLAGTTVVFVLRRSGSRTEVLGALALSDDIRPESAPAVRKLQARGLRVAMITGDSWPVARAVARRLGLDDVVAQVLPVDKDAAVAELQANRHRIAMVGDGVNDAPALARADVGIAIGAGTDVAIESAGVVLAANDPRLVDSVIALSTASYRKMQQNLGWAVGYNLVSVPLAAGVLAPIGIVLPPAVGAILMSLSTIIVATNAQLLRKLRLVPPPD
ncbi:MAG: heavy metal translocating P-type ATPase, partial [Nakamurella sp.]